MVYNMVKAKNLPENSIIRKKQTFLQFCSVMNKQKKAEYDMEQAKKHQNNMKLELKNALLQHNNSSIDTMNQQEDLFYDNMYFLM